MISDHKCTRCQKADTELKRCGSCKKGWYCSRECQRGDWPRHIFDCNPTRPITTADHLALATHKNVIPEHRPTCKDYGFYNTRDPVEQTMLLGLYTGLLSPQYLGVKPTTVHRWRLEGSLTMNIKREFETLPEGERGSFYAWFLINEFVLSDAKAQAWEREFQCTLNECLYRTWCFVGFSPDVSMPEILRYEKYTTKLEYDCFILYAMLLTTRHPAPNVDIWITYGFCGCDNLDDEMTLSQLYTDLIHRCTYPEFVEAYKSASLLSLFRKYKVKLEDPIVMDVLKEAPKQSKSVWYLKRYIEDQAINGLDDLYDPSSALASDYGFTNCKTPLEHKLLFNTYKEFFAMGRKANPLRLHRACIHGRLFIFLTKDMKMRPKPKNLVKELMENKYPLRGDSPDRATAGMTLPSENRAQHSSIMSLFKWD